MINDVKVFDLKVFKDERGSVKKMLDRNHPDFQGFGEIYFSTVNTSVVKGWKLHKEIHQLMCVPSGNVQFVLFDSREGSTTKNIISRIILGDSNYKLLSLPPLIWYSFKCISAEAAVIANCIDQPHLPSESEALPLANDFIPFSWDENSKNE